MQGIAGIFARVQSEARQSKMADLCDEEMEPAILLVSMLGNEHEAYWKRRQAKIIYNAEKSFGNQKNKLFGFRWQVFA